MDLCRSIAIACITVLVLTGAAHAARITVTIENLAPVGGNYLTPVWIGIHDGSFDLYDSGAVASAALERLAEDGSTAPLATAFLAFGAGSVEGTAGPPLAPGAVNTISFELDPSAASSRYLSFATMIIPSNDAFVANGDPLAYPIFDAAGNFLGASFFIMGGAVLDAGTEVNDEIPANTAFFGQMAPDTGTVEGGVIGLHPGFLSAGSGGILDDPMFANADFTAPGYPIAQIRVVLELPEPGLLALLALCGVALAAASRRAAAP